jgi:hypothetical protein
MAWRDSPQGFTCLSWQDGFGELRVKRRMKEHSDGAVPATQYRLPVKLFYY